MLGHIPSLTRSIISVAPVALFLTLSSVLSCVNTSTRTQPFSGFSVQTNDPSGLFSAVKALVDIEEVMPLAGAASLCGGIVSFSLSRCYLGEPAASQFLLRFVPRDRASPHSLSLLPSLNGSQKRILCVRLLCSLSLTPFCLKGQRRN